MVMGATNRPFDIDDAILRRFKNKIYVSLPDLATRNRMLTDLINTNSINPEEIMEISRQTDGYSGSDLNALAKHASMQPIRELNETDLSSIVESQIRQVNMLDFKVALNKIKKSECKDAVKLQEWREKFAQN
jgi:SpoVK/Ycf46/Vps4 family AAA+-type ATPase